MRLFLVTDNDMGETVRLVDGNGCSACLVAMQADINAGDMHAGPPWPCERWPMRCLARCLLEDRDPADGSKIATMELLHSPAV